jgi:hypothetical protein
MFINNRQFIKDLGINTSATSTPEYTTLCTSSEIGLNTEVETQDFYVFCDAIQRHLTTGLNVILNTTIKTDIENAGIMAILDKVHTAIKDGTVTQFNNVQIQFSVISGYSNGTYEYTQYTANATMKVSDLGGAAEDVSEFGVEFQLNGTATPAEVSG